MRRVTNQMMVFLSIGLVVAAVAVPAADRRFSTIDLGTLPGGTTTLASGINNRAQVVGVSIVAGDLHAFLWQRGTMIDLGIPPGARHAAASDINNRGQIVGSVSSEFARAVMWDRGSLIELGTLPGGVSCAANAINDRTQIVGTCDVAGGRSFLWDDGVMTDLGTLPGAPSPSRRRSTTAARSWAPPRPLQGSSTRSSGTAARCSISARCPVARRAARRESTTAD